MLIVFVGADPELVDRVRSQARPEGDDASTAEATVRAILASRADAVVIDAERLGSRGWALAHMLKRSPRWTGRPVVALVDDVTSDDPWVRAARCDAHVAKPCEPDELIERVRGTVDRGVRSAS